MIPGKYLFCYILSIRQLNFYLNVFKRFAFECPIRDISDEFYRVLVKYHVSIFAIMLDVSFQNLPLSRVSIKEDEISSFYKLNEVPKIFETPLELESTGLSDSSNSGDGFEVKREDSIFNSRERTMSGSSLKFDDYNDIDL